MFAVGALPAILVGSTKPNTTARGMAGMLESDANRNGVRNLSSGAYHETSPIDKDSGDDGIFDKSEIDGSWCYAWETTSTCSPTAARVTNPLDTDSDDDGLQDGQEIGMPSAGVDTLVSVFKADIDPSSTTNPNAADIGAYENPAG